MNSKLRGPILKLSLDQMVAGDNEHGHNFQDLINSVTDTIGNVAEYHVRNENGYFVVYYLTYDDIQYSGSHTAHTGSGVV